MSAQLPLAFAHRPALSQADFLIAPPNEQAVRLINAWPDWPGHALALIGPPGSGKSHLAGIWRAHAQALEMDPLALHLDIADSQDVPAVVVEDADRGMDETGLFHLYNLTQEMGGFMLLTGREAPSRWKIALPDLKSRLATVPTAALGAPDDRLLQAVLLKQFHERQLKVSAALLPYLVQHMERSFAAARQLVAALDRAALAEQRPINKALARRVLMRLDPMP
ncbi:MAG: hypothetical protein ACFB22_10430 [Rhodothalassiaceae bacterium]